MEKLFGTDGIRGVVNQYPITAEMAIKIGRVAVQAFSQNSSSPKIIIGKDTRISGDMLENGLIAGICSCGAKAFLAGVIPTPGMAYLIRSMNLDGGVMVSASHNPFNDNGFKFFKGDGFKLSDDAESAIETLLHQSEMIARPFEKGKTHGDVQAVTEASILYECFLKGSVADNMLKGFRIVLDCANGATSHVAPTVFIALGAQISVLACKPDGININHDCGAEHTEKLAEEVVRLRAHVGFAFDGDGDRAIAVDANGNRVSGDKMLAICAKNMKERGQLIPNVVVSTIMSNIGLGLALKRLGIKHFKTQVGDRCVSERMLKLGARIGGEKSGHIIFLDHHTTGDGIIGALKILEIMKHSGESLSVLARVMQDFPQLETKVYVKKKPAIESEPKIVSAIKDAESALGDDGQVVVRYSETEHMLCRIMVGGLILETTRKHSQKITEVVKKVLG